MATYPFQTVTVPGDTFTELLGINDAGEIVGLHSAAANQGFSLALPGTFTPITPPGATQTDVVGVNNTGESAGFFVDAGGTTHGFTDAGGTFATVDAPNTAFNQLLGINDLGQEAGYSSLDPAGMVNQIAYVRQASGAFTDLALPTNVNSQATDINDQGTAVGFYMPTSTTSDGFILDASGHLTTLQAPGSTFTQALGENNEGQVVGFYNDANGAAHGFVYSGGLYTTVDAPGASNTTINGINDAGHVVGFDTDAATGNVNGLTVALPLAHQTDVTSGAVTQQAMTAYTGPVNYLSAEFINASSDNLSIATTQANVFLKSGSGDDALAVTSGQNVLDGGSGSNFLVGGTGTDTFFLDGRGNQPTWDTLVNFHAGDGVTLWGWQPGVSQTSWSSTNDGAAGYQGATLNADFAGNGHVAASVTFAGISSNQASHFQLSAGTVGGISYLHIGA
jgi:probable HAF family extracellular repeat protein